MSPMFLLLNTCLFASTILLMSSSSWFIMWLSLELNMMTFIPMIYLNNNSLSYESMMKYFLIQVLGSLSFILPFIIYLNNMTMSLYLMMALNLAMLLKLAASPFHQWFTSLSEGVGWKTLMILMTWQKINPFIIIFLLKMNFILLVSSVASMIMGSIKAFNQTKLKKIMVLSSITHIGWMISIIFMKSLWIMYMLIYSLIVVSLIFVFFMKSVSNLFQLYSMIFSYLYVINMLSLAGLPPFLGFLPKWITLNFILMKIPLLGIFMIMTSLINIFIYMQMLFKFLLFSENIINKKLKKNSMMIIMNFLSSLLIPLYIIL